MARLHSAIATARRAAILSPQNTSVAPLKAVTDYIQPTSVAVSIKVTLKRFYFSCCPLPCLLPCSLSRN